MTSETCSRTWQSLVLHACFRTGAHTICVCRCGAEILSVEADAPVELAALPRAGEVDTEPVVRGELADRPDMGR